MEHGYTECQSNLLAYALKSAAVEVDVCVGGSVELECFGSGDADRVSTRWSLDGVSRSFRVRCA